MQAGKVELSTMMMHEEPTITAVEDHGVIGDQDEEYEDEEIEMEGEEDEFISTQRWWLVQKDKHSLASIPHDNFFPFFPQNNGKFSCCRNRISGQLLPSSSWTNVVRLSIQYVTERIGRRSNICYIPKYFNMLSLLSRTNIRSVGLRFTLDEFLLSSIHNS